MLDAHPGLNTPSHRQCSKPQRNDGGDEPTDGLFCDDDPSTLVRAKSQAILYFGEAMKKKMPKLRLRRETLKSLAPKAVRDAKGGDATLYVSCCGTCVDCEMTDVSVCHLCVCE